MSQNKCKNNYNWVNTEVNYQWDTISQKYVEVSSSGYCYDGDWAEAMPWCCGGTIFVPPGTPCPSCGGGDDDDGGGGGTGGGDVTGCTTQYACNYNANATVDNGTCQYATAGYNCTAFNINCVTEIDEATIGYGCDGNLLPIYGCMDPDACNYDADADEDNGTCEYNDCNGECGGTAVVDCCGVCGGDDSTCDLPIDIDGNYYCTIEIGDLEWMSENLKTTHYNNGDAIPNITNNGDWGSYDEGQYAVYNNDPSYADIYGNLYNWAVVDDSRGVCPDGWHVPSDEEYKTLEMYLGMSQSEADDTGNRGTNEGSKLAGNANLWGDGNLENNAEFGTSGFNGVPSGIRYGNNGDYSNIGGGGYFWSSTEIYSNNAWYRRLFYSYTLVNRNYTNKRNGLSVRCVREIQEDVYGCTNVEACNYDELANTDNGTCEYPDYCHNCDGDCTCETDPGCECGLTEDALGVCGGDCLSDADGDGICDDFDDDCVGEFDDYGTCCPVGTVIDNCGVCDGDNSSCSGCTDAAACNYNADATESDGSCTYADDCCDDSWECGTCTTSGCDTVSCGTCNSPSCDPLTGILTSYGCVDHQCISSTTTCTYGCNASDTGCADNTAPVANAGPDVTYSILHDGIPIEFYSFTLNGSVSDVDDNINNHYWELDGSIVATNDLTPTFTKPPGEYTFTLTAIDTENASHSDSVTITINAEPNTAPTISSFVAVCNPTDCIANATGNSGVNVILNTTAIDLDSDTLTYNYTGTNGFSDTNGAVSSTDTDVVVGDHTYTVTVTDPYEASISANANITIHAGVAGCTDSSACNYDSSATEDDESCYYSNNENLTTGGPDLLYRNCDETCISDSDGDEVCDELEVLGCTDPVACNYDASATEDDATCTYPDEDYLDCDGNCLNDADGDGVCDEEEIVGCTDAMACNYNSSATDDDDSCILPSIQTCYQDLDGDGFYNNSQSILTCDCSELGGGWSLESGGGAEELGCITASALNYNASATEDDGSCVYAHTISNVASTISINELETYCEQFSVANPNSADNFTLSVVSDNANCTVSEITQGECGGGAVGASVHHFNISAEEINSDTETCNITVTATNDTHTTYGPWSQTSEVTINSIISDIIGVGFNINEDGQQSINLSDYVSGNDEDSLSYYIATLPLNGELIASSTSLSIGEIQSPSFTYYPGVNFNGTDSFTWYIVDEDDPDGIDTGSGNTATVTINVGAINDAPEITDETITVLDALPHIAENFNLTVSVSATDVDGDEITWTGASANSVLSFDPSTGNTSKLMIAPASNWCGTETITITASDGTAVDSHSFDVVVDCMVDAFSISTNVDNITIPEHTSDNITITISDPDTTTHFPTLEYVSSIGSYSGADVTITPEGGSSLTRILNITPTATPGTPVVVQFFIEKYIDDIVQSTQSKFISVTIGDVIDEPQLSLSSNEIVLIEDGDPITVTATVDNPDNFPITWPASDIVQGDVRVAFSNKTNTGATLTISKEDADAIGFETIDIPIVYDHDSDEIPTTQSATLNTTLSIDITNDFPIFSTSNVTVTEGSTSTLLLNIVDADPNHESFTINIDIPTGIIINGNIGPTVSTVTDSDTYQEDDNSKLDYTLNIASISDFAGGNDYSADVMVTVTDPDGNATESTFEVNVIAVDDPPVIQSIGTITIDEDSTLANLANQINIYVDDVDTAQADLLWVAPTFDGWSFAIGETCALDGHTDCQILTITPPSNYCGSTTISPGIQVSDATTSVTEAFTVEVTCLEDTPTIAHPGDQILNEDIGSFAVEMQLSDSDVTTGNHTYPNINISVDISVDVSGEDIIGFDSYTIADDGILTLNFTTVSDANGTSNVTVTATDPLDGTLTSTTSFNVIITPVNDPPIINEILSDITIYEGDAPPTLDLTGYAIDPEDDSITYQASIVQSFGYSSTGSGNNISWSIDNNNILTITPDLNWNGTTTIYIRPYDDNIGSAEYPVPNFNFTVIGVNDAPIINWVDDQLLNATSEIDGYNLNNTGLPVDDVVFLLATVSDIETAINNLTFTSDFNSSHISGITVSILPSQNADYPTANIQVAISTANIIIPNDILTTIIVTVTDIDGASDSINLTFDVLYRDCAENIGGNAAEDVCGNCGGDCTGSFNNATCSGDPSNIITPDCLGVCDGDATLEYDPSYYDPPGAMCCSGNTPIINCCVDSDNSGFCDDNSVLQRDFCGSCPESNWTEYGGGAIDIYGCMDETAYNYDPSANVPCNVLGDGIEINDDGSVNFDSIGECCTYTNAELHISPASAFGVAINSFNIYPRGLDTRAFITQGFFIGINNSLMSLLELGYGDDCTDNDILFNNDACRLVPNHCIRRINTNQFKYDCYLRYPNPNYNGWIDPTTNFTDPTYDPIDDDPEIYTAYRISSYTLNIIKDNTSVHSHTFSNFVYSGASDSLILSGGELPPINLDFSNLVNGQYTYQITEPGTYTVELISSDNSGNTITQTKTFIIDAVIPITQSIRDSLLPWQGINIDASNLSIMNSAEAWSGVDVDGRQSLGVFNYKFDNLLQDDWEYDGFKYSNQGDFITQLDPDDITITLDDNTGQRIPDHINFFDNENDIWKIPHIADADVRMYMKRSTSESTLFHYWDKKLQPTNYNETTAPLDVQFYFYPRPSKDTNDIEYGFFDAKDETVLLDDFKRGYYYLARIDWGDGSPLEYDTEPLKLGYDVIARHSYEKSGVYEITGYMLRCDLTSNFRSYGILSNTRFTVRININPEKEDEFDFLGGSGYTFIPYDDISPIIGGISKDSIYYKSINRQLGYLPDGTLVNSFFERYGDRLKAENALYLMDDEKMGSNIEHYHDPVYDTDDTTLIHSGQYNRAGYLGDDIGFTDIQLPRFFNKPVSMWEMLGFECDDYLTSEEDNLLPFDETQPFPEESPYDDIGYGIWNLGSITWEELGIADGESITFSGDFKVSEDRANANGSVNFYIYTKSETDGWVRSVSQSVNNTEWTNFKITIQRDDTADINQNQNVGRCSIEISVACGAGAGDYNCTTEEGECLYGTDIQPRFAIYHWPKNGNCDGIEDPYPCCTGENTGTCDVGQSYARNLVINKGENAIPFTLEGAVFESGECERVDAGTPDNEKYWKNIIPEYYDIYTDRYGVGRDQLAIDIVVMYNHILGGIATYSNVESFLQSLEIPDSDSTEYICDPTDGCDDYWTGLINDGLNSYISVTDNLEYYDTNDDGDITVNDITDFVNRWLNFTGEQVWNINNNQSWIGDYYYPVLPKFNINGAFTNDLSGKIPFGSSNRNWDDDDFDAAITNENYENESLLISYYSELIERGVLDDNSGNDNVGMVLSDYKIKFDEKSSEPIKGRFISKLNIGKDKKAF